MLIRRIHIINALPLLIPPFGMIDVPDGYFKLSSLMRVCMLDVCSLTVTAAWNFRHNFKHNEYVQHQEEYFQTIILPFCDYNCEMEKIFKKHRFVEMIVLYADLGMRGLISFLYFELLLFK